MDEELGQEQRIGDVLLQAAGGRGGVEVIRVKLPHARVGLGGHAHAAQGLPRRELRILSQSAQAGLIGDDGVLDRRPRLMGLSYAVEQGRQEARAREPPGGVHGLEALPQGSGQVPPVLDLLGQGLG